MTTHTFRHTTSDYFDFDIDLLDAMNDAHHRNVVTYITINDGSHDQLVTVRPTCHHITSISENIEGTGTWNRRWGVRVTYPVIEADDADTDDRMERTICIMPTQDSIDDEQSIIDAGNEITRYMLDED